MTDDEMIRVSDIVTVPEIAARLYRTRPAVTHWITKYPNFPDPLPVSRCQWLYRWSEVASWYERKFGPLPPTKE